MTSRKTKPDLPTNGDCYFRACGYGPTCIIRIVSVFPDKILRTVDVIYTYINGEHFSSEVCWEVFNQHITSGEHVLITEEDYTECLEYANSQF